MRVEDGMVMSFAEAVMLDVVCWCWGMLGAATTDGVAAEAKLTSRVCKRQTASRATSSP